MGRKRKAESADGLRDEMFREQDKLDELNGRLAAYVLKVKALETENDSLKLVVTKVTSVEESLGKDNKDDYDKRISELRIQLQDSERRLDEVKRRYEANVRELTRVNDRLASSESQVIVMTEKLKTAEKRLKEEIARRGNLTKTLEIVHQEIRVRINREKDDYEKILKELMAQTRIETETIIRKYSASETRARDLQDQLQRERAEYQRMIQMCNARVQDLERELSDYHEDWITIDKAEISLDQQIVQYDRLLTLEEKRLKLQKQSSTRKTPAGRSKTPVRPTPDAQLCDIEIRVDGKFNFIKLLNKSEEQDKRIGAWILRQTVDNEEVSYRFQRWCTIKAGDSVAVWSSGARPANPEKGNYEMRGHKWLDADHMTVELVDDHKVIQTMISQEVTTSRKRNKSGREEREKDATFNESIDSGTESFLDGDEDGSSSDSTEGRRHWFWWNN